MPPYLPDILPGVLLFLSITVIFRSGTLTRKLICCIVYFAIFGGCTYLVQVLAMGMFSVPVGALSVDGTSRTIFVLAANALLIAATMLLSRLTRRIMRRSETKIDGEREHARSALLVFITLPLASIIILLSMLSAVVHIPHDVIPTLRLELSALAILIANAVVLLLFDQISRQAETMQRLNIENQKKEAQLNHYDDITKVYRSAQAWLHDKHKHLQTLDSLLRMDEQDKLAEYIHTMVQSPEVHIITFSTGNLVMDAILGSFGSMLQADQTQFSVNMRLPETLPVSDQDLTIIMWNLLENARDACLRIDKPSRRFVRVAGLCNAQTLEIQVVNSMRQVMMKLGVWGLTSKKDAAQHGMGLHIVSETVGAYQGYVSFTASHQLHTANIIVPVPRYDDSTMVEDSV